MLDLNQIFRNGRHHCLVIATSPSIPLGALGSLTKMPPSSSALISRGDTDGRATAQVELAANFVALPAGRQVPDPAPRRVTARLPGRCADQGTAGEIRARLSCLAILGSPAVRSR